MFSLLPLYFHKTFTGDARAPAKECCKLKTIKMDFQLGFLWFEHVTLSFDILLLYERLSNFVAQFIKVNGEKKNMKNRMKRNVGVMC